MTIMKETMMKENIRQVSVPEGGIQRNWLSEQVKQSFEDGLKEYHNLQDKLELKAIEIDVEVDKMNERLEPNTNLSLVIGFDQKTMRIEAQFLDGSCYPVAEVTAAVV